MTEANGEEKDPRESTIASLSCSPTIITSSTRFLGRKNIAIIYLISWPLTIRFLALSSVSQGSGRKHPRHEGIMHRAGHSFPQKSKQSTINVLVGRSQWNNLLQRIADYKRIFSPGCLHIKVRLDTSRTENASRRTLTLTPRTPGPSAWPQVNSFFGHSHNSLPSILLSSRDALCSFDIHMSCVFFFSSCFLCVFFSLSALVLSRLDIVLFCVLPSFLFLLLLSLLLVCCVW